MTTATLPRRTTIEPEALDVEDCTGCNGNGFVFCPKSDLTPLGVMACGHCNGTRVEPEPEDDTYSAFYPYLECLNV